MKPDEIQQLLGGYATGTLTPEERKALFDAALQNQDLFEALAREQALKEVLAEPAARRELLAVLEPQPSVRHRWDAWMRWPYRLGAASALAGALTVIAIVRSSHPPVAHLERTARVADARTPDSIQRPEPPAETSASPRRNPPKQSKSAPKVELMKPPTVQAEVQQALAADRVSASRSAFAASSPTPASGQARALFYGTDAAPASVSNLRNRAGEPGMKTSAGPRPAAPAAESSTPGYRSPGAPPGAGFVGGVAGGSPAGSTMGLRAEAALTQTVAAEAFGVRYSVREAQGSPPQLVIESNADAVLYIFRRGESGEWLPVMSGGMSLKARAPATTPPIPITENAQFPRAVLVLSRGLLPELALNGPALSLAVERLRMQNEQAPISVEVAGASTFVVTPRPSAILVAPILVP